MLYLPTVIETPVTSVHEAGPDGWALGMAGVKWLVDGKFI